MIKDPLVLSILALVRKYVDDHNRTDGDYAALNLLQIDPDNIEAMVERIALWFTSGDTSAVNDYGIKIHQLAPGSSSDLFAQALIEIGETTHEKSRDKIQLLNEALAQAPYFERAWFARGKILFEREKYAEAIKSFDQALQLAPHYAMAMYYAGRASFEIQNFWGAANYLTDYMKTSGFARKEEVFSALANCFSELAAEEKEKQATSTQEDEGIPF